MTGERFFSIMERVGWFLLGMVICLALIIFCAGCTADPPCYDNHYQNVTGYRVDVDARTPHGIQVDTSGIAVDLRKIDTLTDAVEACLANVQLPPNGDCLRPTFDRHIHRACLKVKIAPDWRVGCAGEQVFPCGVDPRACEAKGMTPTPDCPCACRAIIQDNETIVTTPDLRLYTGELLRLVSGCNNIWLSEIEQCYVDGRL